MPTPKYVERIARLPKMFEILEAHPEGLPLSTLADEPGDEPRPGPWTSLLSPLRLALADGRQVRIVYSRQWSEGVGSRVIEPYRLVQTRRGWEVDAGSVDSDGAIRTFLLSNIRSADVLSSSYVMPADVSALIAVQRRTTRVTMELPHDARWAADMYAESLRVVADDDEMFTAELGLLPPVERRVGLITLAGGESTRVLAPGALVAAGPALARELLQHHARLSASSPQPGK